jgi:hypothetical protein
VRNAAKKLDSKLCPELTAKKHESGKDNEDGQASLNNCPLVVVLP